jgi:two-component system, NtrC family, sensor kinase
MSFKMRHYKLPLFWKFSIAIIGIVLLFGSINSILIYQKVQKSLHKEIKKRGSFIAKSVSHQIVAHLLFEDYINIQTIITQMQHVDESVSYIFVLNEKKQLVAHTFEDRFPVHLLDVNRLNGVESEKIQMIQPIGSNSYIMDIASPVLNNEIGTVRMGIQKDVVMKDVRDTINVFWGMIVLFLILGIVGAFGFANFITVPIKKIQYVAENIDLSEIGKKEIPQIKSRVKVFLWLDDEIDILINKFNDMIKRLETAYVELQKTQDSLIQSEKLATVGTLTAGLAHEINNPVAGLQTCIRRLKENPDNKAQNEKYLNMMETAAGKIKKALSDLLNFTRNQSADFALLSIEDVVENALMLVSYRLEKTRISVTKNISGQLPLVMGNKNQLEQVFLNMFLNCVDAMEERTCQEPECDKSLEINFTSDGSNVVVEIKDSGTGIPEEILGNIGNPFFTTKLPGKGSGLGLFISQSILSNHQGSLKFESNPPTGTNVKVSLPKV